jgi:predicted nucleotidyltransferase
MSKAESKAMTVARRVAAFLKNEHGATRVILFGSLSKGFFENDSDIDIYFEGTAKNRILAAAGHCLEVFRQYDIDLTPDAFCKDTLRAEILKDGAAL